MNNDRGIILSIYPLNDSGRIVVACLEWNGVVRGVARHAASAKSPWRGVIDLFQEVEFAWEPTSRSELQTWSEGRLINPYAGIRQHWHKSMVAGYWAKLVLKTTEPGIPVPGVFDLLQRGYAYLERAVPGLRAVTHFEDELARLHGIAGPDARGAGYAALVELFGAMSCGREEVRAMLGDRPEQSGT